MQHSEICHTPKSFVLRFVEENMVLKIRILLRMVFSRLQLQLHEGLFFPKRLNNGFKNLIFNKLTLVANNKK